MKDKSVLNILIYLFKHRMQENCTLNLEEKKLLVQLKEFGFHRIVIGQALTWLNNLSYSVQEPMQLHQKNLFRVFSDYEYELLNAECRRFFLTLGQQGIPNPHVRKLVINQVIELSAEGLDIGLLKWAALMILFNQPNDEKQALENMGLLVLDDALDGVH